MSSSGLGERVCSSSFDRPARLSGRRESWAANESPGSGWCFACEPEENTPPTPAPPPPPPPAGPRRDEIAWAPNGDRGGPMCPCKAGLGCGEDDAEKRLSRGPWEERRRPETFKRLPSVTVPPPPLLLPPLLSMAMSAETDRDVLGEKEVAVEAPVVVGAAATASAGEVAAEAEGALAHRPVAPSCGRYWKIK